MRILNLILKARWYNMIESGEKTEEYIEMKTYWKNRMECQAYGVCTPKQPCLRSKTVGVCDIRFSHVKFYYGNTKRTMTFEIESIAIGKGNPEWGAPPKDVFIIKLGKRIE